MSSLVIPSYNSRGHLQLAGPEVNFFPEESRGHSLDLNWNSSQKQIREKRDYVSGEKQIISNPTPKNLNLKPNESLRKSKKRCHQYFAPGKQFLIENQEGDIKKMFSPPKQDQTEIFFQKNRHKLESEDFARRTPTSVKNCGFGSDSESASYNPGFPRSPTDSPGPQPSQFNRRNDNATKISGQINTISKQLQINEDDDTDGDVFSNVCEVIAASLKRKLYGAMEELVQRSTETVLENFRNATAARTDATPTDLDEKKDQSASIPSPGEAPMLLSRGMSSASKVTVNGEFFSRLVCNVRDLR